MESTVDYSLLFPLAPGCFLTVVRAQISLTIEGLVAWFTLGVSSCFNLGVHLSRLRFDSLSILRSVLRRNPLPRILPLLLRLFCLLLVIPPYLHSLNLVGIILTLIVGVLLNSCFRGGKDLRMLLWCDVDQPLGSLTFRGSELKTGFVFECSARIDAPC